MTKEEAIAVIERLAHTESKWPGTEETLEALDIAVKTLRSLPTTEDKNVCAKPEGEPLTRDQLQTAVPRWIGVDEALPEDSFIVVMAVVYASNGHLTFNGAYQFATYDPADGWNLDDYPAEFDRITVTHWMPLPEPPEGVAVDAKLE